jgi:hypothetical protein
MENHKPITRLEVVLISLVVWIVCFFVNYQIQKLRAQSALAQIVSKESSTDSTVSNQTISPYEASRRRYESLVDKYGEPPEWFQRAIRENIGRQGGGKFPGKLELQEMWAKEYEAMSAPPVQDKSP